MFQALTVLEAMHVLSFIKATYAIILSDNVLLCNRN